MTALEDVHNILETSVWTISLDLKDTFKYIPLHPRMRVLSLQGKQNDMTGQGSAFQIKLSAKHFHWILSPLN